jgi:hypothetical protein
MLRFAAKRGIVDRIVVNSGDAVENRRGDLCAAHLDISRQAYLQTHRLRFSAA